MAEIQQSGGDDGGKKRAKKGSTKVDMTPMVDLGFLLLTFFVMTTTLAKPQIMEINMPVKPKTEEEQSELKASNALTLLLGENDKIYWYAGLPDAPTAPGVQVTNYSASGVRKLLLDRKNNPKLVVLIKPMEKSRYKNLVDILDEMNITESNKYAIVDVDPRDEDLVKNSGL